MVQLWEWGLICNYLKKLISPNEYLQSSRLNNDATYGMSREYMTFSNLYIVCRMNT